MNRISFEGQVVVVTGAGNGIGRAYALEFARRGACVLVNDLGTTVGGVGASQAAADEVVSEIRAAGGKAVANHESVATSKGADAIIGSALEAFGRVDAVVNNAGIIRTASFEALSDEDLDILIDVHLKGTAYVSRAAYRIMREQGYGRIVNTTSAAGIFGDEVMGAYGAAKAGILGLTNSIALAGKSHGILCNAIAPQAATRMGSNIDPETAKKLMSLMALFEGSMSPSFNVPMVVYLASRECQTSKGCYSHCGGRYGRVFTGVTNGWHSPRRVAATAEDIHAHLAEIEDRTTYSLPESVTGEILERATIITGERGA